MTTEQTSIAKTPTATQAVDDAPKAVIYLRVASVNQAKCDDEVENFSIRAQRKACRKKAEQLGVTIVNEYADVGRSGASMMHRTALQAMLSRIEQGDVSRLVIYDIDRLTRNYAEAALLLRHFRKVGVELVSVTGPIDSTPEGQMIDGIMAVMSQFFQSDDGAMEDPSQDEVPDEY